MRSKSLIIRFSGHSAGAFQVKVRQKDTTRVVAEKLILVSGPIGWGIGIGSGVYGIGRSVYDIDFSLPPIKLIDTPIDNEETNDSKNGG